MTVILPDRRRIRRTAPVLSLNSHSPGTVKPESQEKSSGSVKTHGSLFLHMAFGYWRVIPCTLRIAPLTTSPSVTPCVTAPAPVMMLGSFTPSPSQSQAPVSITMVPLPATVSAHLDSSTCPLMLPLSASRLVAALPFPPA